MTTICQVIDSINVGKGGTSVSVTRLTDSLHALGADAKLVAIDYPEFGPPSTLSRASVELLPASWASRNLNGYHPQLKATLTNACTTQPTVLHSHGIWKYSNHCAARVAAKSGAQLVISPRGMLQPWSLEQRALRKTIIWNVADRQHLVSARLLHATSEIERQAIRSIGLSNPVAVIPNGIELPRSELAPHRKAFFDSHPQLSEKHILLFLSRIHVKKGIELLLEVWPSIHGHYRNWELVLAGPSDEVSSDVLTALRVMPGTTYLGPVYGEKRCDAFAAATAFVLPSFSENFGLVIGEALAHGLPVITTDMTPWSELTPRNCGFYIPATADALESALQQLFETPPEVLKQMGERGRTWVHQEFAWERVGSQFLSTYAWLLGQGPRPAWVDPAQEQSSIASI